VKLSLKWLKELVDIPVPAVEVARILTFQGFETKVLSETGAWTKVITAKVTEAKKHPNADKLSLCTLTDGTTIYSVVCGAPNVAAGQVVALARVGAVCRAILR